MDIIKKYIAHLIKMQVQIKYLLPVFSISSTISMDTRGVFVNKSMLSILQ